MLDNISISPKIWHIHVLMILWVFNIQDIFLKVIVKTTCGTVISISKSRKTFQGILEHHEFKTKIEEMEMLSLWEKRMNF